MLSFFRKKTLSANDVLDKIAASAESDFVSAAAILAAWLRTGGARDASENVRTLIGLLRQNPQKCTLVANMFFRWFAGLYLYPTILQVGIFSRNGFLREFVSRLYDRINPPPKDEGSLKGVLAGILGNKHDLEWLFAISPREWLGLYRTLAAHSDAEILKKAAAHFQRETLYAAEMLSVWVAAEELNPDLLHLDKRLLDWDSPLMALQREMIAFVDSVRLRQQEPQAMVHDDAHARVMLDQSRNLVARLRRRGIGVGAGSSLALAHLLERLDQTLNRLELLLNIHATQDYLPRSKHILRLLMQLMQSSLTQNSALELWRRSIKMLAKSISNSTGDHGEHYLARTRREAFLLWRSAAGAGVLIALMALIKIKIGQAGLSVLATSVLSSLNYGFGFVLIHMLHCTVATKQPAMTAASFAAEVERNEHGRATERKLAPLLITVSRSQTIAVFGNVSIALLVAAAVSLIHAHYSAPPLLDENAVAYQIHAVHPFSGLALFYAAIAGVWLFCSGIIAGFFDNRADYLHLRRRLYGHPLMVRLVPQRFRMRIADYLHDNYGAIAGNFFFGILLGMTAYLGYLTGLPLDIRHVAFSSANIAYAALSGHEGVFNFLMNLFFVLLIGLVNLWVSFALALAVALRSREARLGSFSQLLKCVWMLVRENPRLLFFPPAQGNPAGSKKSD